ncbi:PDR/VanB family oxidoreductase [Variovorax guangxiensis]|uniref:PDR/VanB family oxidoreductase n=1 Tax=Variovorax guangxiensis TaxID=1775474 RepID=UPI002861A4F5|nr:PDR/VanB family oxidoreductase [Variovorax guangxiensis]MDR6855835.1 vanillate O-demethylase ferredoxin subunit [Variovorax guangxiensis]
MSHAPLIEVRLRNIRLEAEGIASYEFVPVNGTPLPAFTAGAHIDLHLPREMVRSYSLVNAPSDAGRYVVAVQRDPQGRGGSAWMHEAPRVSDRFRISAPSNDFALAEDARQSVFIAGGIGITPVMSMLRRLDALGRDWKLHYASRAPEQTAFIDELRSLQRHDDQVAFCFGATREARLSIRAIVEAAPRDAHLYCCGPGRMIEDFLDACAARPAAQVHYERFSASSEAATEGGFEVVLKKSGQRFEIAPGKTILDTLLDHQVDVQYSCSAGVCGTCRTGVIDGQPDHRDDYLTDEEKRENRSIMVCCSGARSKTLVLDL